MSKLTTVAVYGSLRQDMGNHRILQDSEFLGVDVIDNMGMVSFGAYPACDFTDDGEGISVELYVVDEETALRLDRLEGCDPDSPESDGNYYSRRIVATTCGQLAWVYFIPDVLNQGSISVDSGDWVAYVNIESRATNYG